MAMVSESAMRQRAADTALSADRPSDSWGMEDSELRGVHDKGWSVLQPSSSSQRRSFSSGTHLSEQTLPEQTLLLLGVAAVLRSARAGRTDEQLLAVREGDVTTVGACRAVLGLEALDEDLRAGRQRV